MKHDAPRRVTVAVPVFNGAATLGQQLAALQRQRFDGDLQLVVVDNMSSDASAQVAHSFGVRVVEATGHQSVAHARNVAIASTDGDLVLFCDADDVVEDTYVAKMAEAARWYDLVGGEPLMSRDEFDRLDQHRPTTHRPLVRPGTPFWRFDFAVGCSLGVWRTTFNRIGAFDRSIRYSEDVDYSLRTHRSGLQVGVCNAAVFYRQRPTARATFRQEVRYGRSAVAVYTKHRGDGMQRRPTSVIVNRWGYWILRAPRAVADQDARVAFARNIGKNVGHLVGSAATRVWYP